jgi:PAS domain S-box-containing protein
MSRKSTSTSLTRRFARAAAVLTAAAVLLISLASFWLIERQRDQANALLVQREVAFHATTVSNNLQALTLRMADVASSPILATGLIDSAGKETYLAPFLRGLRQINGIPVQVLFTDFEGKAIAGNGGLDFSDADLAWLRQRIASDSEMAAIRPGPHGDELLGVNLLRYSRSHTPEGALMYKVRLADLNPAPSASVVRPGTKGAAAAVRPLSGLPASLSALGLELHENGRKVTTPLETPAPQYVLIFCIAALAAGVVFLVGSRLALGLTEDLRGLEAFATSLGDEGMGSTRRAPLEGSSEVVNLAQSINLMLDRLYQQHAHLEAERQKFLQLSNTIPQLVWIADPDGTISWFNDRWYEYTGKQDGDMDPQDWHQLHDPAVLPEVQRRWKEALGKGSMDQMTFPLLGKDGRFHSFFTSVAPLRDQDGRIVQWFGTCTDVSQLEEAERAASYSEQRLQQGMLAARMAVWERDLDSGDVTYSANLKSVFGVAWENIRQCWELVEPEDRANLIAGVEQAIAGRSEYRIVIRVRRPDDGELVWLDARGDVGPGKHGDVVMHAVAIDITERKRAEEALRLTDRRKDEFLAMLAHELRNPLAPISSAADMLRLAYASEPRVRQISDIIARQVGHMRHLVDDLLDVSRVTRGLVAVAHAPIDFVRVVTEAAEQARPLVDARHHEMTLALPLVPMELVGDHTRLVQVVTNLLNNAAKYTPDGGRIDVSLDEHEGKARLEVRDNGVGIGPDLLPAVFELFTQATRTLDRTQGGLGLGLALVKKLVELHGGTVAARSSGLGTGSAFIVCLPLVHASLPDTGSGTPAA